MLQVALGDVVGHQERTKTHYLAGHPYGTDTAYVTSSGKRMCRTCRRRARL